MTDKNLERDWIILKQVDELTEHVARLTGLILEMNKLFNVHNAKLDRIIQAIEEAERVEGEHDIH